MDHIHLPISSSAVIIIQEESLKQNFQINKLISRLGWISFILGACAFLVHYISIDRLANFSPINSGIISGIFLIIAGLTSINAGYRQTSLQCFRHARIWSFMVSIIFAPGLIVVSIIALVLDSQDLTPLCENTLPSASRVILFGNSFEVYASNIPCPKVTKLINITQMLNIMQLMIGIVCFFIHIVLLSMQRKILQRMSVNENDKVNQKITVYPQAIVLDQDPPPKYEDLLGIQPSAK